MVPDSAGIEVRRCLLASEPLTNAEEEKEEEEELIEEMEKEEDG